MNLPPAASEALARHTTARTTGLIVAVISIVFSVRLGLKGFRHVTDCPPLLTLAAEPALKELRNSGRLFLRLP